MDRCSPPVRDRTDRCPGVLRLHEAADGWMARVRLPGGRADAVGLRAVADVASWGNGIVELTSRASLQVRGLAVDAGDRVAARLADGGLLASLAHDLVRNVLASPVAGRAPSSLAQTDAIVVALDRGLCADAALAALPGRFLFAVDDGAGLADARSADVALVAEWAGLRLWLAGDRTTLVTAPDDAPRLALDAARAFLELAGDGCWRVADLAGGAGEVARALGGRLDGGEVVPVPGGGPDSGDVARLLGGRQDAGEEPASGSLCDASQLGARSAPRLGIGVLAQCDGRFAITVLPPLGRVDRAVMERLAALADEVRLSSARTLTLVDIGVGEVDALVAELAALGLVTSPGSGWVGLSACAGAGACASARADVRAAAVARARMRSSGALAEHWSACERGCGRPAGVAVSVVATAGGGLSVQTEPGTHVDVDDVSAALALLGAGA